MFILNSYITDLYSHYYNAPVQILLMKRGSALKNNATLTVLPITFYTGMQIMAVRKVHTAHVVTHVLDHGNRV